MLVSIDNTCAFPFSGDRVFICHLTASDRQKQPLAFYGLLMGIP